MARHVTAMKNTCRGPVELMLSGCHLHETAMKAASNIAASMICAAQIAEPAPAHATSHMRRCIISCKFWNSKLLSALGAYRSLAVVGKLETSHV